MLLIDATMKLLKRIAELEGPRNDFISENLDAPKIKKCLGTMLEYLQETHRHEVNNGHCGDDEAGEICSYCTAIAEAKTLLEKE